MASSTKRLRQIQRSMHLGISADLLLYLYTPLGKEPIAGSVVRIFIIPMLILAGLGMWQLPRLRTLWERRQGRSRKL